MAQKTTVIDLVLKLGLAENLQQAQGLIMSGNIVGNNRQYIHAHERVLNDTPLRLKTKNNPKVSRGYFKLQQIVDETFNFLKDKVVMDIGASTGGFSQCALENGAKKVYAVESGTNQLDYKLKTNPDLISLEAQSFTNLNLNEFKDVNCIVADVSLISSTNVFDFAVNVLSSQAFCAVLLKPQYEYDLVDLSLVGVKNYFLEKLSSKFELVRLSECHLKGKVAGVQEYISLWKKL